MSYSTGFGAVKAAVESSRGSDGPSTNLITWKDGETRILRFISDEPVTMGFHSWFRCPDGKRRDFACANDLVGEAKHDCPICKMTYVDEKTGKTKNFWPSTQSLGLVVDREPVLDRGRMVFVRDKIREESITIKKNGEEKTYTDVPEIGMIKQSIGNFWNDLAAYYARYGTIVDRDYEITRRGSKTDTKYTIVPVEVDEELRVLDGKFTDIEKTRELIANRYKDAVDSHPSVIEYIERMGNKKRYDSLLNAAPSEESSESEEAATSTSESSDSEMSSFEARLKSFGSK